MMSKVATCLWFDTQAEEAANFYVSTFRSCGRTAELSQTVHLENALYLTFTLDGQEYIALNGGPHYQLSAAVSIFVKCDDQADVDRLWDTLLEGGQAQQCGWLTDRFGLSWQIVPTELGDMMATADPDQRQRIMTAMMQMIKLDAAKLRQAYNGH